MELDYTLKDTIKSIGRIVDKDFNIAEKENTGKPITRYGARGVILDENKIAVIYKEKKNEYKLPGGGIDKGETPKNAFIRECEEELGITVKDIEYIGNIEEYKSQENFKQISYVFIAKKDKEYEGTKLTEKEQKEGTTYLWISLNEALEKMNYSLKNLKASEYDDVYRSQFMVLRDIRILEYIKLNRYNLFNKI